MKQWDRLGKRLVFPFSRDGNATPKGRFRCGSRSPRNRSRQGCDPEPEIPRVLRGRRRWVPGPMRAGSTPGRERSGCGVNADPQHCLERARSLPPSGPVSCDDAPHCPQRCIAGLLRRRRGRAQPARGNLHRGFSKDGARESVAWRWKCKPTPFWGKRCGNLGGEATASRTGYANRAIGQPNLRQRLPLDWRRPLGLTRCA